MSAALRATGGRIPINGAPAPPLDAHSTMHPMSQFEMVKPDIKVCMFDLYGTVVDIQSGLTRAAAPYLKAKGWTGEPSRLVTWWRRAHFENSMIDALLGRAHIPYREIGRISLDYTLERAGVAHTQDEVKRLVSEIERLRPFPDEIGR